MRINVRLLTTLWQYDSVVFDFFSRVVTALCQETGLFLKRGVSDQIPRRVVTLQFLGQVGHQGFQFVGLPDRGGTAVHQ